MESTEFFALTGPGGSLHIFRDDTVARQLAMLFEGECLGKNIEKAAADYGYTRGRYYQVLDIFNNKGAQGLTPKKRGPKANTVRTDGVVTQIIRHKFFDPDAGADVITQKMRQCGITISKRSVERTITEFGLQKKTTPIQAARQAHRYRDIRDKGQNRHNQSRLPA